MHVGWVEPRRPADEDWTTETQRSGCYDRYRDLPRLASQIRTLLGFNPPGDSRGSHRFARPGTCSLVQGEDDGPRRDPPADSGGPDRIRFRTRRSGSRIRWRRSWSGACLACHGPKKASASFRVDTFARLMARLGRRQDHRARQAGREPVPRPDRPGRARRPDAQGRRPACRRPRSRSSAAGSSKGRSRAGSTPTPNWPASSRGRIGRPRPPAYRTPVPISALAFRPDGLELAVGGYHEVTIWDPFDRQAPPPDSRAGPADAGAGLQRRRLAAGGRGRDSRRVGRAGPGRSQRGPTAPVGRLVVRPPPGRGVQPGRLAGRRLGGRSDAPGPRGRLGQGALPGQAVRRLGDRRGLRPRRFERRRLVERQAGQGLRGPDRQAPDDLHRPRRAGPRRRLRPRVEQGRLGRGRQEAPRLGPQGHRRRGRDRRPAGGAVQEGDLHRS